jgi:cellulose synthase/poly-beta-1,6-N-acetylglucosamine synthase-like glycosyltransferase
MTGFQTAVVGIAAILAFFLGVADFEVLCALLSAALWLIFSASVMLRSMAAIANGPEVFPSKITDDKLPNYTIVVALYHEASVVEDLVKAIDALDYPKGKLDIKLVVEQRDVETFGRLVELGLPGRYEVIVAPLGKPQTKPRALNITLSSARGDLIVVYDAEDIPASNQLHLAASRFAADKDLDCLQARLAIRNHGESWLSKLFAIEYAILFDVINPGLCALDLPIPLGGSSNHFRVRSLVGVGAWDEWNVTEDADLGVRLARFGYRVKALDSDTWEEAPFEVGNWFRQRARWQKGWMQTLIVHARRPIFFWRDLGPRRAVAADLDRRNDFWMFILAGFRCRDDLACSYGRTGRNVPVEGNERRLCLHPCAIGRLDSSCARCNRRQVPPLKCNSKRASAGSPSTIFW